MVELTILYWDVLLGYVFCVKFAQARLKYLFPTRENERESEGQRTETHSNWNKCNLNKDTTKEKKVTFSLNTTLLGEEKLVEEMALEMLGTDWDSDGELVQHDKIKNPMTNLFEKNKNSHNRTQPGTVVLFWLDLQTENTAPSSSPPLIHTIRKTYSLGERGEGGGNELTLSGTNEHSLIEI